MYQLIFLFFKRGSILLFRTAGLKKMISCIRLPNKLRKGKIPTIAIIVLLFTSCVNTKYVYDLKKGKELDFSNGKWILNKPHMNENISHTYNIALKEFRSILGDSLLEIDDLRASYLIEKKLPYRPTQQQLEDIRNGTRCNFIINYEILVLNNQTGSFAAPPPIGNTRRINEATVEILIFDLKTLELISQSSVTGRAKVDISQDESGGNIVEIPSVIARKALSKLIEQYDRNQIK